MKVFLKQLDKIEEYILLITFPLMLLFIFSATMTRFFDIGTFTWGEEAARYLMIWAAFSGISLGFKKNSHLGLSFFVKKFPSKFQKFFYFVRAFFIILFGVLVSYFSSILISTQIANRQLSPSLGIPLWVVYFSILFGSVMIIIGTIIITIQTYKTGNYDKGSAEGGVDV